MTRIDPDILRFAVLNMTGALLANPQAVAAFSDPKDPQAFAVRAAAVGKQTALQVLGEIDAVNVFQFPNNDPIGGALRAFAESRAMPGRLAAEDKLQEGELFGNAVALLSDDPLSWDGDETSNPYPGSGEAEGEGRINDLCSALFYVMAEIQRLQRNLQREADHAAELLNRAQSIEASAEALPDNVTSIGNH